MSAALLSATAEIEKIRVPTSRVAHGSYAAGGTLTDQGDISAAYSADLISMSSAIRVPFRHRSQTYIAVAICGDEIKAYRLDEPAHFPRPITNYTEKTRDGDAARADPFGFYDGMKVKQGGRAYVLSGPPVWFIGDDALQAQTPQQLSLF